MADPSGTAGTPVPDADLRAAGMGDADDVARLLGELGYPCTQDEAAERIAAVLADDRQALVLARDAGRVCGLLALDFMYYLPLGAQTCRITALVVGGDSQRRGLGRLLLREAERRARVAGCARLELTSAAHRHEAHAFYRACGFAESSLRFAKALGAS